MKRLLFATLVALTISVPAWAGDGLTEGIKISGTVEVHYLNSSDTKANKGDDEIKPEELYLTFDKAVTETVHGHIKLDGADMNESAHDDDMVEEAYVEFKNAFELPISLYFGKDEMPFGQDYEKFLLGSRTHKFEIDKVWGLHAVYKIKGFGSVAGAFFERDTSKDVSATDSYAFEIKAGKFVTNLSIEASVATRGKEEGTTEEDESRYAIGAKFKLGHLTLHAEITSLSEYNFTQNAELDVILAGVDYKIDKVLLKARYESVDEKPTGTSEESRAAVGVSYYFDKKAVGALEFQTTEYAGGKASEDIFLLGVAIKI